MPPKGTRMEQWYMVAVTTTDDKGKQIKTIQVQPTAPEQTEDDQPTPPPVWVAVLRTGDQ